MVCGDWSNLTSTHLVDEIRKLSAAVRGKYNCCPTPHTQLSFSYSTCNGSFQSWWLHAPILFAWNKHMESYLELAKLSSRFRCKERLLCQPQIHAELFPTVKFLWLLNFTSSWKKFCFMLFLLLWKLRKDLITSLWIFSPNDKPNQCVSNFNFLSICIPTASKICFLPSWAHMLYSTCRL